MNSNSNKSNSISRRTRIIHIVYHIRHEYAG